MKEKLNLFIANIILDTDEYYEFIYEYDEFEHYFEQWQDKTDEYDSFYDFGQNATNDDWLEFFKSFSDSEILNDVDSCFDFKEVVREDGGHDVYKGWEESRIIFKTKTKFWEFNYIDSKRGRFADNEFEMNEVFPREETVTITKTVYETKAQLSENK